MEALTTVGPRLLSRIIEIDVWSVLMDFEARACLLAGDWNRLPLSFALNLGASS